MNRTAWDLLLIPLLLLLFSCGGEADTVTEDPLPPAAAEGTSSLPPDADGIHEIMDQNGDLLMRGEKINGKREGGWTSYFPNGNVRSQATFVNGLQQGPTVVYHENGNTFYAGWYKDGKPVKDWTFYDENGNPVKIVRYSEDGILLEEREL